MKKIILVLGLLLVLISACSDVPYNDRVKFCEDRDMTYSEENSGRWYCRITDLDYVKLNCCSENKDEGSENEKT